MILLDIDECTLGTSGCNDAATCENTAGSFICTCDTGYSGDGFSCVGKCLNYVNLKYIL